MKPGDIVLVPFPFTNLSAAKTRPALVIYENAHDHDMIALSLTSQFNDFSIKVTNKDLVAGELPVVSFVRYQKVATLDKSLVDKKIAVLKASVFEDIMEKFKKLF
ncbi:type II toxin-antitoxin system PemK/MazF family toxin [Candidatus Peregrinibacteria bacterium]|nr:type II toxin-antitoxin system PemK/MazF family toxin [Candidatus Peregrinibacteria bacterium]